MSFFGGFKASKLKPQLKMAVHRLQINSNQKVAQIKNQKRDIAKMLGEKPHPKEEKARIRAEALIREDHTVEAYEILQLNCELLAERIKLLASEKTCPPDMVSVVSTVLWASTRVDVPEFLQIRKQFRSKYGKEFERNAMNNVEILNERVYSKLSIQPPSALLVQTYLEKIAEEFNVDWKPAMPLEPDDMALPVKPPTGDSIPAAPGSGYKQPPTLPTTTGSMTTNKDEVGPPPPPVVSGTVYVPPTATAIKTTTTTPGAYVMPYPPPEVKANMATATVGLPVAPPFAEHDDSDDEGAIYVPEAPSTTTMDEDIPVVPTRAISRNYKNDDDDDDDEAGGGGGLDTQDSFRDLQARFANLKK